MAVATAARSTKASVSIALVMSSLLELLPSRAAPKREAEAVVGEGVEAGGRAHSG